MADLSYNGFADFITGRITEDSRGRLRPFFREEPVLDEEASRGCDSTCPATCTKHQGRPVFKMVDYVRIQSPGERDNIPDRPVNKWDRQRFAKEYDEWRKTKVNVSDGTPLETWTVISKAQVEELKFFHITTIEDLANLNDSAALKFRGIVDLKQKAKDYVAALAGEAPMVKMRTELKERDELLSQLKKQLEDQGREIEKLRRR